MIIKNNNILNKNFLIFFFICKKFFFYIQQINKTINIKTYLRKKMQDDAVRPNKIENNNKLFIEKKFFYMR